MRTQAPFKNRRIGIYDPDTGEKIIFDCHGEAIRDDQTGDFLAGMVTYSDVTALTTELAQHIEQDARRFEVFCGAMPQMVSALFIKVL